MRILVTTSIILLAACSGGAPEKAEAPQAAAELEAGQWETITEVTRLTSTDKGKPVINTPAGTKTKGGGCVGATEGGKPPPALFAMAGDKCAYKSFYMARGRVNASLSCTRPGLQGPIMMSVEGTYSATGIDAGATVETYFTGSGDVKIVSKITGSRAGPCPAAGA